MDRSYVGPIIRLALLAPYLVEAIVEGREPNGLSLERLVRRIPMGSAEQQKQLSLPETTQDSTSV